jgi:tetratricopeptide (TPR) repeat protein
MGLGWTGIMIGFVAAGIALGGFTTLSAASVNFTVNSQRYRVLPEGRLKSGIAFLKLGKEYQRMGMWAMAVAQYRAAVAAAPDRAEHYKALGIGYNKLGRTDRALRALEQAVRLDPSDVEARTLVKRLRRTDDRPAPAPAAER